MSKWFDTECDLGEEKQNIEKVLNLPDLRWEIEYIKTSVNPDQYSALCHIYCRDILIHEIMHRPITTHNVSRINHKFEIKGKLAPVSIIWYKKDYQDSILSLRQSHPDWIIFGVKELGINRIYIRTPEYWFRLSYANGRYWVELLNHYENIYDHQVCDGMSFTGIANLQFYMAQIILSQ